MAYLLCVLRCPIQCPRSGKTNSRHRAAKAAASQWVTAVPFFTWTYEGGKCQDLLKRIRQHEGIISHTALLQPNKAERIFFSTSVCIRVFGYYILHARIARYSWEVWTQHGRLSTLEVVTCCVLREALSASPPAMPLLLALVNLQRVVRLISLSYAR